MKSIEEKTIYEDEKITISESNNPEEHDLYFKGNAKQHFILARGVLDEIAHAEEKNAFIKIRTYDPYIPVTLSKEKIPFYKLHLAFSQARLKELGRKINYLQQELSKYQNAQIDL